MQRELNDDAIIVAVRDEATGPDTPVLYDRVPLNGKGLAPERS